MAWLEALEDEELLLPSFVVMEFTQGCRTQADQRRLQKALAPYPVIWPPPDACDEALNVFVRFFLCHSLGIIDALFGQFAASLDLPQHSTPHHEALPIPSKRKRSA